MNTTPYNLPEDLLYNEDSSWIRLESGVATIGIIHPVATTLKEFLFVQLPEKKSIRAGDIYVSLETLKWSGHLTSPLTGSIIDVNQTLYDEPSKINADPYGSWIIKLTPTKPEELHTLRRAQDITPWLNKTLKR
ncbi:MAG: glycine cleavage system protein H [Nitrosarchaeum sp.]|nr:glycine cleavage system protein H [Nitrosarchaeum sp.]